VEGDGEAVVGFHVTNHVTNMGKGQGRGAGIVCTTTVRFFGIVPQC